MSYTPHASSGLFNDAEIKHRDGIAWYEVKRPLPLHKCKVQTSGWVGLVEIQRCACGGMRTTQYTRWFDKNQRWRDSNLPVIAGVIAGTLAGLVFLAIVFLF